LDELGQFLASLITEGGSLGVAAWAVSAAAIVFWEQYLGKPQLSNDKKRWVSLLTPVALVNLGYWGGIIFGYWELERNTLFQAGQVLLAELGGAKALFTLTKAGQEKVQSMKADKVVPVEEAAGTLPPLIVSKPQSAWADVPAVDVVGAVDERGYTVPDVDVDEGDLVEREREG
jgi:hypothetical protein